MADSWSPSDIPDLTGVRAVVTGANSGLGLNTAIGLARHGASVVLACRDAERGRDALQQVRSRERGGVATLGTLDLASLDSVRAFAATVTEPLDLLVNNAGVMALPQRRTADGFEMQLGTNHLGHFALTGLLLPRLLEGSLLGGPARVVAVSSALHRRGTLHRDDLMLERSYQPWTAYQQSKLANLLFVRELQRRADAAGAPLTCAAAHPGYAATNLQAAGPEMSGSRRDALFMRILNVTFATSAEFGSRPTLRAATDPSVRGGDYFGPSRFGETRGAPGRVGMSAAARDDADAAWLWDRSVELTGVDYAPLASARA